MSALKATTQRLDKAVLNLPKKASGVDKPLLENLVKDLKRHERSLETNTTILKLNRVTRDFENDPRLYYVDNVIKDWRQCYNEEKPLGRLGHLGMKDILADQKVSPRIN